MFTFDFTRTMGEETSMNDLFQVVEELKNGHVVSVLYGNPMEVAMTSPHVVIFTNEKFEDYEKYLSRDRWMFYVITPEKALAARKWDTDKGRIALFNLLSDYFQNQLNIINDNLHDITNPGYTYLFLAILIKIWRAYINGQSN